MKSVRGLWCALSILCNDLGLLNHPPTTCSYQAAVRPTTILYPVKCFQLHGAAVNQRNQFPMEGMQWKANHCCCRWKESTESFSNSHQFVCSCIGESSCNFFCRKSSSSVRFVLNIFSYFFFVASYKSKLMPFQTGTHLRRVHVLSRVWSQFVIICC